MKPITKALNKKRIMIYYSLALIFVSIGLFLKDATRYIVGIAFLFLGIFRRFWLMKKLRE